MGMKGGERALVKDVSSALGCVNFYFRGGVLGDDKAQGVALRAMAEVMMKVGC